MDERGVGDCPDRPGELGHVWVSSRENDRRPCRFCGTPGRGNPAKGEGGYFADATAARSALIGSMKVAPQSVRGTTAKEARNGN